MSELKPLILFFIPAFEYLIKGCVHRLLKALFHKPENLLFHDGLFPSLLFLFLAPIARVVNSHRLIFTSLLKLIFTGRSSSAFRRIYFRNAYIISSGVKPS